MHAFMAALVILCRCIKTLGPSAQARSLVSPPLILLSLASPYLSGSWATTLTVFTTKPSLPKTSDRSLQKHDDDREYCLKVEFLERESH
jgi:hypothetical protein